MNQFSDDTGISYGYVMIALFFGAAILMWMMFSVNLNVFISDIMNPRIIAGTASMQTRNSVNLLTTMWTYVPPAIFLGGFIWSVRRAIYIREGGQ